MYNAVAKLDPYVKIYSSAFEVSISRCARCMCCVNLHYTFHHHISLPRDSSAFLVWTATFIIGFFVGLAM